jgi:uncharacterized protein with HEPN domain
MKADDRIRLRHMLDASLEAQAFVKDRKLEDLSVDRMLLLSLVKEIEIIGKAASALSEDLRDATSHIPWVKIKGVRKRLIHAYCGRERRIGLEHRSVGSTGADQATRRPAPGRRVTVIGLCVGHPEG